MNRASNFIATHMRLTRWLWFAATLLVASSVAWLDAGMQTQRHARMLQADALRKAVEIGDVTMQSRLMGALTELGLTDRAVWDDAAQGRTAASAALAEKLMRVGRSFGAEAIYVVNADGFIRSNWEFLNNNYAGLDVGFASLDYLQIFILGVIQGITELLPISSTAHMRIVPALLGWQDPGSAFSAAMQMAALAAVISYFWSDVREMAVGSLRAVVRRDFDDWYFRFVIWIGLATIPIGLAGLALASKLNE